MGVFGAVAGWSFEVMRWVVSLLLSRDKLCVT